MIMSAIAWPGRSTTTSKSDALEGLGLAYKGSKVKVLAQSARATDLNIYQPSESQPTFHTYYVHYQHKCVPT